MISKSSKDEEIRATADLELIREWFAYNDYVKKEYLRVLESLTTEQLSKDRGSSFPSFLDISAHIYFAYCLSLKEMYDRVPLNESDIFGRKCSSIEELKEDAEKINPYMIDFPETTAAVSRPLD